MHPPPIFIFIRQPVPFFPTAIFTVGENEDGEAGGWLYPPSFYTHTWIAYRARTNTSFSPCQAMRTWPLAEARWDTKIQDSMQWPFHSVPASRSLRVVRPWHHTQRGSDQDTWKWHLHSQVNKNTEINTGAAVTHSCYRIIPDHLLRQQWTRIEGTR